MPLRPPEIRTPKELIKEAMRARDWMTVPVLARMMEGDELRNRVMLDLFFTKGGALGPVLCDRIGEALDISGDTLSTAEEAWARYWKEVVEAGKQLNAESQRIRKK